MHATSRSVLRDARYYLKIAAGLARYQLSPPQADPVQAIREQMQVREERFLDLARSVLAQRENVYGQLFDNAGCTFGDLQREIRETGLRTTLGRLMSAGVYITHEELIGRREIVRSGRHLRWHPGDLDNPHGRGSNMQATSGSTGPPRTIGVSGAYLRYREGHEWLHIQMTGVQRRSRILVAAALPSVWPIRRLVTWSRLGVPIDRWFAPGDTDVKYRWLTRAMVEQSRLLGARVRAPERLPPNDFSPVAAALATLRQAGRPAHVRTVVSMASRIAAVARERGLDITGTLFSVSGEALTAAKRALIESTGSAVQTFYGAVDFGTIGYACHRLRGDAVHLLDDALLVIAHRLPDREQPSLFVSNQLVCGPQILINVGIDDRAAIEPVDCDCEYQRLGFTWQARDIFSYGKVTAQGMTIDAQDLTALIETVLPERFGGAPGDYQLVEVEGEIQSAVVLRISPRAGVSDPSAVQDFVFANIARLRGGSLSERLWRFSGGMRVVLEEPETTSTGKVHALRLIRRTEDETSAARARDRNPRPL